MTCIGGLYMAKAQYNADSITVLEGLEAVRKRPGMYIGGVGTKGLNHLIYEIVDNAVDEHLAGFCTEITVTLEADGSCTVKDNGRGIPVEMHKKGVSAERVVLSTLHAGGKFDNNSYKTSGGLHGVGSSVVNALSDRMKVKISRDGKVYYDEYEKGHPVIELKDGLLPVIGKSKETGTEINFLPDPTIFEKTKFKAEWLKSRLHESAYLNPNLALHYVNKRAGEEEMITYHEPDGIIAYVRELNNGKEPVHEPVYFKGSVDQIEVEVAFQFVDAFEENILGFCNNIFTQEGGTHLVGFKTKFTQLINSYARELGILKEKDSNFTGADTRNGMTAVVAVKHPDPIFEGQTKTKLASADATKAVFTMTGDELERFFDRNLDTLKAIIACAEKSAKIRKAEEKAKKSIERAKKAVGDLPVIIDGSATIQPFGLAEALLTYGFHVVRVEAQECAKFDRKHLEWLGQNAPDVKMFQPQHHRAVLFDRRMPDSLAIGMEGAYLSGSRHVADLLADLGMFGYDGVCRLMEMMEQAALTETDLKKQINDYGLVV